MNSTATNNLIIIVLNQWTGIVQLKELDLNDPLLLFGTHKPTPVRFQI